MRNLLQRIPAVSLDLNCLYFLEYPGLPPAAHTQSRAGTRVEIRGATREDLAGLARCEDTPQTFLDRFRANDSCVVAVDEGRIVGYQWFCTHAFHIEERYSYAIEVPEDTVYSYDAFILPQYRLTGLWLKFHSLYLRGLMRQMNRSRIVTLVDRGNRLSISTHLRFGYRPFRVVLVAQVLGKSFFLSRALRQSRATVPMTIPFETTPDTGDARTSASGRNEEHLVEPIPMLARSK